MTETLRPSTAQTSWPDGWYIFEDGEVKGPLAAEQAFSLAHELANGKPRLVSRKGFAQWYPLKDLAEVFRLTAQMSHKVATAEAVQAAAAQLQKPLQSSTRNAARPSTNTPKVVAKPIIAKPTATTAAKVIAAKGVDATPETTSVASMHVTKGALLRQYFYEQKTLRLGTLRNPWLAAFLGFPLSLGLYWFWWFRDLTREVTWHAYQDESSHLPPSILAAIPGLHIYMVYRLAREIKRMEQQNHYTKTSIASATLLSLLPPLVMLYLQRKANHHWLLHVQSSLQRANTKS